MQLTVTTTPYFNEFKKTRLNLITDGERLCVTCDEEELPKIQEDLK